MDSFGFLGTFGALGVSCSVTYLNVLIREAIAYSIQAVFVIVLSVLAFKLVVVS